MTTTRIPQQKRNHRPCSSQLYHLNMIHASTTPMVNYHFQRHSNYSSCRWSITWRRINICPPDGIGSMNDGLGGSIPSLRLPHNSKVGNVNWSVVVDDAVCAAHFWIILSFSVVNSFISSIHSNVYSFLWQAFIEICLLSGGTPQANFKHFCHAWGRDATFVSRLSNFICERRGELDRKKLRSTSDGTTAITTDPKLLKRTGVIIPRTASLDTHRKSIATDTMLDQPDVVNEPTAMMPPTVDTAVDDDDELEIDHESTSFLIQEEGPTTDVNPQHQPAHRGITEV